MFQVCTKITAQPFLQGSIVLHCTTYTCVFNIEKPEKKTNTGFTWKFYMSYFIFLRCQLEDITMKTAMKSIFITLFLRHLHTCTLSHVFLSTSCSSWHFFRGTFVIKTLSCRLSRFYPIRCLHYL